jgi:hypothetical protein
MRRAVIQGAVGLDVGQLASDARGACRERPHLHHHGVEDLLVREADLAPAEAGAVGVAHMGTDRHAALLSGRAGLPHDRRPPGVKAARHVDRRDQRDQLGVQGTTFAEVAIQVEVHERETSGTSRSRVSAAPPGAKGEDHRIASDLLSGVSPWQAGWTG